MCELLDVSKSGYYDWIDREESDRTRSDRRLVVLIRAIFEESDGTYGSPRVYRELRAQGERVSEKRVARLMRQECLRGRQRRAWRRTTDSAHGCPIKPNTLDRAFDVDAPNQVWAGDTTYIATPQGWLFLVVVLDLFSRRVVGWSLGHRLDGELACRALRGALHTRRPKGPLLFHSDRGIEFACSAFQAVLDEAGAEGSMSRTGDCWDNAVVESFFSTLKIELIYRRTFKTRDEVEQAVFRFLEGFYNQKRRHSTLGYVSPAQYEQMAA
jgi:transposase InsO family protein